MLRHVLCVYPYRVELSRYVHMPPLGLETIAAVLSRFARQVEVIDLRLETGRTVDFIRSDTDLVCFSVNWGCESDFVTGEIRSVPAHLRTIVGGRHATLDPDRMLRECPNVDIVVRGDGEETIEEICRGVPNRRIAGISFRADGSPVHTAARQVRPVGDEVYPDRSRRRYSYAAFRGPKGGLLPIDSIASSRGCPFNCRFCSFSRNPWGRKRPWSARSPESVVRELEQIEAPIVGFVDDNFAWDLDRVAAICDLIVARGIRKAYAVNARVEIARRPDVLAKMNRAGFAVLLLGIESAQDRTLRSMSKGFDTAALRRYFRVLRRSQMVLHGYFILGCIGESERDMLGIAPFARELGLDTISLSTLRNEPHSGIDELVAAHPGYHVAPDGRVYSDELSRRDLARVRRRIVRRFYRPGKVLRTLHRMLRTRMLTVRTLVGAAVASARGANGRR